MDVDDIGRCNEEEGSAIDGAGEYLVKLKIGGMCWERGNSSGFIRVRFHPCRDECLVSVEGVCGWRRGFLIQTVREGNFPAAGYMTVVRMESDTIELMGANLGWGCAKTAHV